MITLWYFVLAAMLTAYAVLDGFDFGVGIVHLAVARTNDERRQVLAAIGPLWDGNEVWLIAAGGLFVFAFPSAYAAAFSGLYLALMVVLWLLVLRGLSIELRSQVDHPLWRDAWDAIFAGASALMAIVLGVALGNVVRGVPLDASGFFREDLFPGMGGAHMGAIDGFTGTLGVLSLVVLGAHGATFLAWKTTGQVNARSRALASRAWLAVIVGTVAATGLIAAQRRAFFEAFFARPWLWPLPAAALAAASVARRALGEGRELRAFLASCAFVAAMLIATAGTLYPLILRSTVSDAYDLDAFRAASGGGALRSGLWLLAPALALAVGYFVLLFRSFRGKSDGAAQHY
jgi:cytochrome d ubiquinol oxidase subunit II